MGGFSMFFRKLWQYMAGWAENEHLSRWLVFRRVKPVKKHTESSPLLKLREFKGPEPLQSHTIARTPISPKLPIFRKRYPVPFLVGFSLPFAL
jgi:hypothetical protein